jgi:hypothetical protein
MLRVFLVFLAASSGALTAVLPVDIRIGYLGENPKRHRGPAVQMAIEKFYERNPEAQSIFNFT